MNDREALLAAICQSPEDDHLRLVYADWLEEHGTSDADRARAEYIRLQCELEKYEEWSPERFDAEERTGPLFNRYGAHWQQDVPAWARLAEFESASGSTFRRGFLHRISCNPNDLLQHPGNLMSAEPIREGEIGFVRDGGALLASCAPLSQLHELHLCLANDRPDFHSLGSSPYLSNLTDLKISLVQADELSRERDLWTIPTLGDADARQIAASPSFSKLEALRLSYHEIGPDGILALIESPYLTRIKQLDLASNPIGILGIERLSQSQWCGQLTGLDISGVGGLSDDSLETLMASKLSQLRRLRLGGFECQITDRGFIALANSQYLTNLRDLSFGIGIGMYLREKGIRAIFQSPNFAGLRSIFADGDPYGESLVMELARSPHIRQFRSLYVSSSITDRAASALATSSVCKSLVHLALGGNEKMGSQGAIALASSEQFSDLRFLDLSGTKLGPDAVRTLAFSTRFPRLRVLNISRNPIGDEGGKALCESPDLARIRGLVLFNCGISEPIKAVLRERFGDALHI